MDGNFPPVRREPVASKLDPGYKFYVSLTQDVIEHSSFSSTMMEHVEYTTYPPVLLPASQQSMAATNNSF